MILIDGFAIDCAESEEHTFENEVTEHPVERGADIADHVRARPLSVSISGIVSDTPIGAIVTQRGSDGKPSDDARAKLEKLRDDGEPIAIETSLRGYTNMVLERVDFPRAASDGDSLRFRATFRQVILITNERTTIRVREPRNSAKVDRGNKATAPVTVVPEVRPLVDVRKAPVRRVPIASGGSGYAPPGRIFVGNSTRTPIASGGG